MADPVHVSNWPATVTSRASAVFSTVYNRTAQNSMSRSPFLDTILARPGREGRSRVTKGMFGKPGMKSVGHKVTSGLILYFPINYKEPTPGKYIQGLDTWTYTLEDYNTLLQWPWRYHAQEIAAGYIERWENRIGWGGVKMVSQIENRIDQKTRKAYMDIGNDIINGAGGDDEPDGLVTLFPSNPTTAGTTIGGLDVSTYTDVRPKYNGDLPNAPAAGAAGDFASQYRDAMIDILNDCLVHQAVEGYYIWLAAQDVWQTYFAIQHAGNRQQRSISSSNPNAVASEGYTELYFQGFPMIWDQNVPSGNLFLLNVGSIMLCTMQDGWGAMLPWRELENRAGRGTALIHGFQLATNQPRASGRTDGWT